MKGYYNTEYDGDEQQSGCTSHHSIELLRAAAGLARLPDSPELAHKDLEPLGTDSHVHHKMPGRTSP